MKTTYRDGYIERRTVDGREKFFFQIDSPLHYGKLRDTADEAKADGRKKCGEIGVHVPCFFA